MTKLEEEIAKRTCEIVISNRNESLGEGGENIRIDFFGPDPEYAEFQFDPAVRAGVEVAKKYIEKAIDNFGDPGGRKTLEKFRQHLVLRSVWLKENGII